MRAEHRWRALGAIVALGIVGCGCRNRAETPEQVANAFLREIKRDNCAAAWKHFSSASMQKIREESAKAIEREPHYAEQFKPENLYCVSTYANRFDTMIPGTAKLQAIEGSNATVIVQRREPAGFALPGFSPMGSKKVPDEVFLVQENAVWKIDVVRPTSAVNAVIAARNHAMEREQAAIRQHFGTNVPPPPPPPPVAR
jgi:hypothetical protein